MDKFLEETQIRISMTKDATGTALTVNIKGAKNCSTYLNLAERAAKRIPAIQAAKNPPIILNREFSGTGQFKQSLECGNRRNQQDILPDD